MKEPKQSFDIDGCRTMYRKLEHEFGLCRSNDREHLSGHLVNFAMTAYHLIEWVWEDLEHQPATKNKVAAALGIPTNQFTKNAFVVHVMHACPGMEVCQAIANGTKHVEYDGPRKVRQVETFVSSGPSHIEAGVTDAENVVLIPRATTPMEMTVFSGTPKVIVDGVKSGDVREIFDQVLQWWTDFIYGHNIDRFNGPHSGG